MIYLGDNVVELNIKKTEDKDICKINSSNTEIENINDAVLELLIRVKELENKVESNDIYKANSYNTQQNTYNSVVELSAKINQLIDRYKKTERKANILWGAWRS